MISYGRQISIAEMLCGKRSHQLGEGHKSVSEVLSCAHPPRLVYGSQSHGTAMSHLVRSHQLGEGQQNHAAVSLLNHPSRPVYGRDTSRSQQCQMRLSLPTSLREPLLPRSNAHLWSLPLIYQGKGHHAPAEMPFMVRPSHQFWATPVTPKGHAPFAQLILTRGHRKNAAMPSASRLATKEIQYGYKI